jgi:CheY-like chemotaxis protein
MKRVLIIDDDCVDNEESILADFEGTNVEVILCENKDQGLQWINSKAFFDCIVLDWYLGKGNENSLESRLVLKALEQNYYSPVLIYSAHSEIYRAEKEAGEFNYPDNLIQAVDKSGFNDIKLKVTQWLDSNTTAKLSNIYIEKVYEKIHKTFWSLNEIPHGNIASVYKHIIAENGSIDWENDFIINMLLQSITSDDDFRNKISEMVVQLQAENPATSPAQKQKILNKILYSISNSPFINNGDIFKIQSAENISYGIITSPDCDLAQGKTKYIDFVELREQNDNLGNTDERSRIQKNNSDSHFLFLSLELTKNSFTDLVGILKSKNVIVCQNNDAPKYPSVLNRIKYSDSFNVDQSACRITYLCSLVNPYKAEFSQRKTSHDSRVGIPSVYKYFKAN